MTYTSLLEGYTPYSVWAPFARETPQYILEHVDARHAGICGLTCVIIGIIIASYHCSPKEAVDAIKKHYIHRHQEANNLLNNIVSWYHHGFINSNSALQVPIVV
jgi:hypothetical protein